MKIHIIDDSGAEKTYHLPTGFLFSKLGVCLLSKAIVRKSRRDYDQTIISRFREGAGLDDLLTPEDVQASERLTPPITQDQARELLTALKDSKYLLGGLPLISVDLVGGERVRIDL